MKVNNDILNRVENNSLEIEKIVMDIVCSYTQKLDDYMLKIQNVLESDEELTEDDLNRIMIKLCSYMYFMGTKQELLGIRQSISEAIRDEKYNLAFLESTGTVAAKESQAENIVREEQLVEIIYNRAYKIMKNKYDATDKWIDSIKKILTLRNTALQLGIKSV